MFGPLELLIVLAIVLLVFGARRLPSLGRDLGSGMREFKDGLMPPKEEAQTAPEALPGQDRPAAAAGSGAKNGVET